MNETFFPDEKPFPMVIWGGKIDLEVADQDQKKVQLARTERHMKHLKHQSLFNNNNNNIQKEVQALQHHIPESQEGAPKTSASTLRNTASEPHFLRGYNLLKSRPWRCVQCLGTLVQIATLRGSEKSHQGLLVCHTLVQPIKSPW